MMALTRDAHARKLVSIVLVFTLAQAYEQKIRDLEAQHKTAQQAANRRKPAARARGGLPRGGLPRSGAPAGPAAPPDAPEPEGAPAKDKCGRGRKRKQDTEDARAASDKRANQRFRLNLFRHLAAMSLAFKGSKDGLTRFMIEWVIRPTCAASGLPARHIHLARTFISNMFDDPAVGKALEKEYEKRKRPRIARFVLAKVSLVTFAAMDALRFASPWIPGHTTLCKAGAAFQERILKTWCPCGPKADGRTRQTRAEQQAAAFADANNEEEPDDDIIEEAERAMADEAVREPTARETQEVTAESFAAQGMDLLQKAYPDHSSTKVLDQWGGGVNDTPLFEDANLVHIVMHKAGTMLGFMKCLMTKREIFVDEVLVDLPLCKGKALASHMMDKATTLHKKPQLVRLQVDIENAPAIFLYKGDEEKGKKGWGMEWWEPRPKRTSAFYKVEELCDAGCKFMEGPRLQVGAYAKALADAKPVAARGGHRVLRHGHGGLEGRGFCRRCRRS